MSDIAVIGTGDFARELMDIVYLQHGAPYFVANSQEELEVYRQRPYRSRDVRLESGIGEDDTITIGIGDPQVRRKVAEKLAYLGVTTVVHPSVINSEYLLTSKEIYLSHGVIIAEGCILTNRITIGEHALINLDCTIGHDVQIGAYSNLSPGCHINGHTTIGKACSLGSGVVTIPGASICDNCVIGAGAVVRGKIEESGTYVGIPAKRIK